MKLVPTENYEDCVLLGKESMLPYFLENHIPWDLEKRISLYASFEIYEVFDHEFIGYLALRENQGSIFIADLQILESHRNKGYGAQLLIKAKEMAKNRGYDSIKLKVFKSSPAINLYKRNGYVTVGVEEFVYLLSSAV
jgi:ribosomal protein S18 acetylase RimI-like enzyme